MAASTRWPFHSMVLVSGSSVTSIRSDSPASSPSWMTWSTWPIGNSGFVMEVGSENVGWPRSTRPPSEGDSVGDTDVVGLLDGAPPPAEPSQAPASRATARPTPISSEARRAIAPRPSRSLVLGAAFVLTLVPAVVVRLGADDVEVLVEVHLDLAAVLEADLDAVGGAAVADLGLDDRAAARLLKRRIDRTVERRTRKRLDVVRGGRAHPR